MPVPCNCGSSCSCQLQGDGMTVLVTGIGAFDSPWVLSLAPTPDRLGGPTRPVADPNGIRPPLADVWWRTSTMPFYFDHSRDVQMNAAGYLAPTVLTVTVLSSTSVRLDWTSVPGALSYRVTWRQINGGTETKALSAGLTRTITDLVAFGTYTFTVTAYDSTGYARPTARTVEVRPAA